MLFKSSGQLVDHQFFEKKNMVDQNTWSEFYANQPVATRVLRIVLTLDGSE